MLMALAFIAAPGNCSSWMLTTAKDMLATFIGEGLKKTWLVLFSEGFSQKSISLASFARHIFPL